MKSCPIFTELRRCVVRFAVTAAAFPVLAAGTLHGANAAVPVTAPAESLQQTMPPELSPAGICEKMFVIGASASNGFCIEEMLGGPKTGKLLFSRYLSAALKVPHAPVNTAATRFMFLNLKPLAEFQIAEAQKARPSVVVAMDFLFWFCYGRVEREDQRLPRLEEGLKMLDTLPCPLVVGDLPDASAAVGRVLDARQLPAPEVLQSANRRVREWAQARKNTVVVPLAAFMSASLANQPITIHSHTWPAGGTRDLLQGDRLHPEIKGCAALALKVMDVLIEAKLPLAREAVDWDPEEIFKRALEPASAPKNGTVTQ